MRTSAAIGTIVAAALAGGMIVRSALQSPAVRPVDEKVLREYPGVYQWGPNAFVYLQLWNEFTGTNQLTAFDESGDVRVLYPTDRDRFFTGPGAAIAASIESRVEFQRDPAGRIAGLTWQRDGAPVRTARRVDIENHEDIYFSNGDVRLAGTLVSPTTGRRNPAIILVHASGPANREQVLPFGRFFIRHGVAMLAYDKRGVGGSSGDWNVASLDDLAGDVVAAFEYLKTRSDIDSGQIGLLGWSQAGWIMPIAAVRAPKIAFLISVAGAAVPPAETTIDQATNEMTGRGMQPQIVEQIVGLMKLQYTFARTGQGWDEYLAARDRLAARLGGPPPDTYPGTPDHPSWQFIRRLYFHDPAPTLRLLRVPTLALFGELDNNILAQKNKAAWEAALKAGGHGDYTLRILPKANHLQLQAKIGSNAEMKSLRRFVPEYVTTIHEWLAKRIRGYKQPR